MHEPTLSNSVSPKMMRETLCLAQSTILSAAHRNDLELSAAHAHVVHLQKLIAMLAVIRPLGSDGKHGDGVRCTGMCGCRGRAGTWTLTP